MSKPRVKFWSDFVKPRREQLGLTQRMVAEKIDVKPEFVFMIENDERDPALDRIGDLARVLRYNPEQLCRLFLSVKHPTFYRDCLPKAGHPLELRKVSAKEVLKDPNEDQLVETYRDLRTSDRRMVLQFAKSLASAQQNGQIALLTANLRNS